jgi:hypothetical protein
MGLRGRVGKRHHGAPPFCRCLAAGEAEEPSRAVGLVPLHGHQAPTHVTIPDDSQQPAVQDADLLTKHSSDQEQWFD